MKVIGLLGGMSWESTVPYYQVINETVREQLGGLHSAKIVLFSVDFAEIEEMQVAGRWDEAGALLAKAAAAVDRAGADFLVICTNTMHIVADQIARALTIPILHIADTTAAVMKKANVRTVGLLATKFTMEKDFYRSRIEANGFRVLVPDADDRLLVHRIIYDELCRGRIEETSRQEVRRVIDKLVAAGAEGIIFGCTEIGLLAGPSDSSVPVFDTAAIHARAAAELAIKG
ncbi:MAG: aspartate/glutamate racemase family protein [Thermoanaerobaculia bacterium]